MYKSIGFIIEPMVLRWFLTTMTSPDCSINCVGRSSPVVFI